MHPIGRAMTLLLSIYCAAVAAKENENSQKADRADVLLVDAQIYTVDAERPLATTLAIRDDRVMAVGTRDELQSLIGPQTKFWSAHGHCVTPGFIEGHGHFLGLGQSLQMLDLSSARSWEEIISQVQLAASQSQPGQWVVGRGWHQEKWTAPPVDHVDGYPRHDALSQVSPLNPVLLTHASGHACFANEYAMKLAGIDGNTANPPGGELIKTVHPLTGEILPIGVFRETATALIQRIYDRAQQRLSPESKRQQWLDAVQRASRECLENGITSFQDAGSSIQTIQELQTLNRQNDLTVRLWLMILDSNEQLDQHLSRLRTESPDSPFLTVRAIKRSMDGALGAHGAWLLSPYEDLNSSIGLNTSSIPSIEETARLALRERYQLCVHAIGDRANREVLDLYQRIFTEAFQNPSQQETNGPTNARSMRWRIEHAQHLSPADIPRFVELGVIPAMQGIHCPSDAVYVLQRLGYRRAAEGAYAWRALIDSGAWIVNGSDAPVERISPVASFYASVTRRMPGVGGPDFFAEQAMTRQEALLSYTLWAAYGAFEEHLKGSLAPGKFADFTIWSQDLMSCPVDQIPSTTVLATIVGGRIGFEGPGFEVELPSNE